jgi:hypothetical protein
VAVDCLVGVAVRVPPLVLQWENCLRWCGSGPSVGVAVGASVGVAVGASVEVNNVGSLVAVGVSPLV